MTVAPETAQLDARGWDALEATVLRALRMRPARMQRQVALLLTLIEHIPVFRYGRRFSRLPPQQRHAFLDKLQHAPLVLLRRGVWGLRTLVFMGFYTNAQTMESVGYRAHARGWAHRAKP